MSAKNLRVAHRILLFVLCLSAMIVSAPLPAAPRPALAQAKTLLTETFQNNDNGWKLAGSIGTQTIGGGKLIMDIAKENVAVWSTPDLTFPDDLTVSVDVVAPTARAGEKWNAAIAIRADNRDTSTAFYQFEIDGTGTWAFVTRTAKAEEYKVQKSGKIDNFKSNAKYSLLVQAVKDEFTFTVNKVKVGTFRDDKINSDNTDEKYIGLLAGTFTGLDATTIEFSNLVVSSIGATTAKEGVLLEDDFSSNKFSWAITRTGTSTSVIEKDSLIITGKRGVAGGVLRWAGPLFNFPPDIDVTVDVQPDTANSDGLWYYGIGFRYYSESEQNNFYLFIVQSNGQAALFRFINSKSELVGNRITIPNFRATQTATMRVVVVGNKFDLFVNDRLVTSVTDTALKKRDTYNMVLAAGTLNEDSAVATSFKNLVVRKAAAN